MTFTSGLCLFLLCCLVPTLSVKEKSTDHRLIYQSEDIIKQQDAEEAKLKNVSALGSPKDSADSSSKKFQSENAIEYLPKSEKVPMFGEANHGKLTETVVVQLPEGLPEICSLPKRTGKCRGRMPRYFFNVKTKECERFIYGGCDGNDNRFLTIEDCDNTCHIHPTLQ